MGIAKHFKLPYFKKYNQLVLVSDVKKISSLYLLLPRSIILIITYLLNFWNGGGGVVCKYGNAILLIYTL